MLRVLHIYFDILMYLSVVLDLQVMASVLGTPERGDWKACKLDIEEETSMADRFKEQFQSFDLMQSLV
jgi:hypothetical protein